MQDAVQQFQKRCPCLSSGSQSCSRRSFGDVMTRVSVSCPTRSSIPSCAFFMRCLPSKRKVWLQLQLLEAPHCFGNFCHNGRRTCTGAAATAGGHEYPCLAPFSAVPDVILQLSQRLYVRAVWSPPASMVRGSAVLHPNQSQVCLSECQAGWPSVFIPRNSRGGFVPRTIRCRMALQPSSRSEPQLLDVCSDRYKIRFRHL